MSPKLDPSQNRYYPSPASTGALHNDFRKLFDHVYSLQDQLTEMHGKLAEAHSQMAKQATDHANAIAELQAPANTKMLGLRVRPTVLQDMQVLTYVAAKGDFEFM